MAFTRRLPTLFALLLLLTRSPMLSPGQDPSLAPRVRAPEFPPTAEWLNTEQPLKMADLRGQVVVLDFWTYCCINCLHILPDLKFLEDKYRGQPLVVIGVHSGKFDQEKDPDNIRQAIRRHNIAHPVVVDSDYTIWRAYGVRAWPTLVVIDPEGKVVTQMSGEGHRGDLDRVIRNLLDRFGAKGALAQPREAGLQYAPPDGPLAFPGKVLADAAGRRLFISDTNHHRVLVADLDGQVTQVIGSGAIGLTDGTFAEAQFHQPQGLELSADHQTLYVADTENHALRAVDLDKQRVTTVAGNGQQAAYHDHGGRGRAAKLNSPWDLARVGDRLYIAMAGTHQIWVCDLDTARVAVFAGSGREDGTDGPNRDAAFAQPSGLATDGRRLFVADSEISTIRAVELSNNGSTSTVAGSGGLFDFGARDGRGRAARFQHPLGVALSNDTLFVADTFNHLIRRIDLKSDEVTTFLGTGRPEIGTPAAPGLFEPGGLSMAGDTLYVADTNHHRILAVDIATRQVRALEIRMPAPSQ
ncbi:MAG: redoxin domain-containing protein [Phycisphaerae bacterium]|jgi:sugar lactone lactonase YvrE/peroxiredoxin